MSGLDWRSANGYDRAQDAEITGFAWECLRRNPNYQRDQNGIPKTPTVGAEFRKRGGWGVRASPAGRVKPPHPPQTPFGPPAPRPRLPISFPCRTPAVANPERPSPGTTV